MKPEGLIAADQRNVRAWLLHCADPVKPLTRAPRRSLTPDDALALVAQAELHGVLPTVARNFAPLSQDFAFATARADVQHRLREARALTLMLRAEGRALLEAAAELPVAMVKGEVFATTIYPDPALRPYSDIDLLAAPRALPALGELLAARGLELVNAGEAEAEKEWKWLHRQNPILLVEVHTDLMQGKRLKRRLSLTFDELGDEAASPAGCLVVAILHGAYSHHFAKVRHIVDICQAARAIVTAADERAFERLVERIGARYVAAASLELAGRLMNEPRCRDVQRGLGIWLRGAAFVAGHSFEPRDSWRFRLNSWRGKALRELMRWSGH